MPVTQRQIAREVGVSHQLVSFALNETGSMTDDTRRQILATAERLGYQRNELARSMSKGQSRMIGYLVPNPDYEASARMLVGALDEASAAGYTLKLLRTQRNDTSPELRKCLQLRVAGVVSMGNNDNSMYLELSQNKIPLVVIERETDYPDTPHIFADEAEGARLALEHLHQLGHRRIAYIAGYIRTDLDEEEARIEQRRDTLTKIRQQEFLNQMVALGLDVPNDYVLYGNFEPQVTADATRKLLRAKSGPPTAIFCVSDETAMVVCRTLRAEGLRVPQDVSVVGYSDLGNSELFDPALTTIAMPFEAIGRAAIQQLLARMPGSPPAEAAIQPTFSSDSLMGVGPMRLVVRESSGPVAVI